MPAGSSVRYSIDVIQDEARQLVEKGVVSRQQPIYVLCQYIPAREWVWVEGELERCNFLLRDRICDLLGQEEWSNDWLIEKNQREVEYKRLFSADNSDANGKPSVQIEHQNSKIETAISRWPANP